MKVGSSSALENSAARTLKLGKESNNCLKNLLKDKLEKYSRHKVTSQEEKPAKEQSEIQIEKHTKIQMQA